MIARGGEQKEGRHRTEDAVPRRVLTTPEVVSVHSTSESSFGVRFAVITIGALTDIGATALLVLPPAFVDLMAMVSSFTTE